MATAAPPSRTPYDIAQDFTGRVRRLDDTAARAMVNAYRPILDRIVAERGKLAARIEALGPDAKPWQITAAARLDRYQANVAATLTRWAAIADGHVDVARSAAGGLGTKYGVMTTDIRLGRFMDRLPNEAVWAMVANTQEGMTAEDRVRAIARKAGVTYDDATVERMARSLPPALLGDANLPVRRVLEDAARGMATDAANRLAAGVALGMNPRRVAGELARYDRVPLTRALTIARTESLRAYRESSRAVWRDNPDVVQGWVWMATLDARTCASCLAQHGSKHLLADHLASHPNCRCAMLPFNADTMDMVRYPTETDADEWLRSAPASTRRAVLGRNGARAYERGDVRLGDFVRRTDDPVWGRGSTQAPLRQALDNARAAGRGPLGG